MNDLDLLNEAWDAPAPDPRARAAARAALLERAAPARRRRRFPRWGVRLAAVGVGAAVIATGTTVARFGGERGGGAPVAGAAVVLDRAARAAEGRPFTEPRPKQWIYIHYRNVMPPGRWTEPRGPLMIEEQWRRADGWGWASRGLRARTGKLYFDERRRGEAAWPPADYAALAALPTDPDALLALMYRKAVPPEQDACPPESRLTRDDVVFRDLMTVRFMTVLPPKVEAAVYRAMMRVPGVALTRIPSLDGGGPAVGLGRSRGAGDPTSQEMLLDARTYRFLGLRSAYLRDPKSIDRRCVSGIGPNLRVVATGVVDRAGTRPR